MAALQKAGKTLSRSVETPAPNAKLSVSSSSAFNPKDAKGWFNKGNALRNLGKHDEAIKAYDEAIRLDPNYVEAWNNKGNALNDQGKHNEAIEAYDKTIGLDRKCAAVWNNKGIALNDQGKHEEA